MLDGSLHRRFSAPQSSHRRSCDQRRRRTDRFRGAARFATWCGERADLGATGAKARARRRCRLVTVIVITARLDAVCITALEPRRLADFWAEALRWCVDDPPAAEFDLVPLDGTVCRVRIVPTDVPKAARNRHHFDLRRRGARSARCPRAAARADTDSCGRGLRKPRWSTSSRNRYAPESASTRSIEAFDAPPVKGLIRVTDAGSATDAIAANAAARRSSAIAENASAVRRPYGTRRLAATTL